MVFFLKKIFLMLGLCCFLPSQAFQGNGGFLQVLVLGIANRQLLI